MSVQRKKIRITVGLEPELHEVLAIEAEESGRSISDLVRDHLMEVVLSREPAQGVAQVAEKWLRKGLPDEEVLAKVKESLPEARTSKANIAWYRSRLRKTDPQVPTQVEAKRDWPVAPSK